MKKKSVILVIILLVSIISLVLAETNETFEINETEAINETEIEDVNETETNITSTEPESNETAIDNETEVEYTDEELADIPEAGITPDNPLYGVDVFVDNARATLTPSSLGKAEVRLEIMQERMAEMEEMANKNKVEEAKKAGLQVQKQMQKFDGSIRKIKKKDAEELKQTLQANTQKLEMLKQRLRGSDSGLADAIADALEIIEITEDIIVNIPEDLDSESTFIISSGSLGPATYEAAIALCIETGGPLEYCEGFEERCEEAGAETVNECLKIIAQEFADVELKSEPLCVVGDETCKGPLDCDKGGSWVTRKTRWCCFDSDKRYSLEFIARQYLPENLARVPNPRYKLDYYHRKGTVEYKIINLKTGEIEEGIETDSCNGDTLIEWGCPDHINRETRNERYSEEYDCELGCEDGACISEDGPEAIEECTDSDGGLDYFVKGTVIASISTTLNGQPIVENFTIVDSCMDDLQLREGYCTDYNGIRRITYSCPNGCEDGVCL